MKAIRKIILNTGLLGLVAFILCSAAPANPINIKIVNFKTCVEQSKIGKKEQAAFESLKKQMETILEEKEKSLNEIATKFNDPDYLDSLSPEAETELKRKFRALNQELSQHQNQYYQALQQANFKIVQKLTDAVTKASEKIAKEQNIDLVLNEESFYYSPSLDISSQVIKVLDETFAKDELEAKDNKPEPKKS